MKDDTVQFFTSSLMGIVATTLLIKRDINFSKLSIAAKQAMGREVSGIIAEIRDPIFGNKATFNDLDAALVMIGVCEWVQKQLRNTDAE